MKRLFDKASLRQGTFRRNVFLMKCLFHAVFFDENFSVKCFFDEMLFDKLFFDKNTLIKMFGPKYVSTKKHSILIYYSFHFASTNEEQLSEVYANKVIHKKLDFDGRKYFRDIFFLIVEITKSRLNRDLLGNHKSSTSIIEVKNIWTIINQKGYDCHARHTFSIE